MGWVEGARDSDYRASSNRYADDSSSMSGRDSPQTRCVIKPVHHAVYTLVAPYRLVSYFDPAYHSLSHSVSIAHAAHAFVAQRTAPQAHKSTANRRSAGSSLASRSISINRLPSSSDNSSRRFRSRGLPLIPAFHLSHTHVHVLTHMHNAYLML